MKVPTCVLIQVGGGHDSAGDGPACKDLSLHLMPALQSTVLGDHEALVVPQRGAGAIRLAREALVLVVALQNKAHTHRHRLSTHRPRCRFGEAAGQVNCSMPAAAGMCCSVAKLQPNFRYCSSWLGVHETSSMTRRTQNAANHVDSMWQRGSNVLEPHPLVFSHVGVAGVNGDSVLAGIMVDGLVIPCSSTQHEHGLSCTS